MPPITTAESNQQEQASSSSVTSSILKERRFKLSRACDRCRRRRIKCDEGHPCQACLTANSACTFEEPGKRTHPHKSKRTATLEDRMQHLESLIQAIPPAVFAAGGPNFLNHAHHHGIEHTLSPIPPFGYPMQIPSGVPPPSLHVFPLTNPSNHFHDPKLDGAQSPSSAFHALFPGPASSFSFNTPDQLAEETSKTSHSASYLYFDDEGHTRWQGETSGLPVLDLLLERHVPPNKNSLADLSQPSDANNTTHTTSYHRTPAVNTDWFPNRKPLRTPDINPQTLWRLITAFIPADLMDSLVQCYLSTSSYILPFLHVPTFLADYGTPQKWGEPGFAAFIVSICCLASRHIDDPRVRADPNDGVSAGTQWFELLHRLRTLPIADRPTLYNIQANLIGAVYAVGLGRLSKAAALLGEAVTMCIDAGLHRSADTYDVFDAIEEEVRKRTFWCVYIWDKQLSAHFGRPPVLRLRDCDVGEPTQVDDEFLTKEGIVMNGSPPPAECRLTAFVMTLRIMAVLESVLDIPPPRQEDPSSFIHRAAANMCGGENTRRAKQLREEEAMLDELHRIVPPYWAHTPETLASEDTIRVTQAERLHCAEQFVRLLIYRHRFSEILAERHLRNVEMGGGVVEEQSEREKEALIAAHNAAVQIVAAHLHIVKKGLMTYYGVHVIHQLTQAGRTLVAILLCCKTEALQHLIPSGLDAVRSCVGLLKRFSGRYVCGMRSGDLMEEFCRLTQIPLDLPSSTPGPNPTSSAGPSHTPHSPLQSTPVNGSSRPAWIRPVRKKSQSVSKFMNGTTTASSLSGTSTGTNGMNGATSDSGPSQHSSPEGFSPSDFFNAAGGDSKSPKSTSSNGTASSNGIGAVPTPAFGIGYTGFNGLAALGMHSHSHGHGLGSKIPTHSTSSAAGVGVGVGASSASSPPSLKVATNGIAKPGPGSSGPRSTAADDPTTQLLMSMSPVDMIALFESGGPVGVAAAASAGDPARGGPDAMDVQVAGGGVGLFATDGPFGGFQSP